MSESNVWIRKFNLWRNITRKGCTAGAGPGGVFCIWVGRNCSYNDCPRRSHEEIYVKSDEAGLELEQTVEQLKNEIIIKDEQITTLTEKLKSTPPEIEKIETIEA